MTNFGSKSNHGVGSHGKNAAGGYYNNNSSSSSSNNNNNNSSQNRSGVSWRKPGVRDYETSSEASFVYT